MRLKGGLAALAGALFLCTASAAWAYPQFQFTTGNSRCNACHYNPSGGGLLTGWGRGESADTISRWGGEGAFLYGVYEEPDWVQLGVDVRAAFIAKDHASDAELKAFPMQGDTYARFALGDKWSIYTAFGPRAQVREPGPISERFGARELWAMWSDYESGLYVRGGRFLTPFGLRSQDHTWYVRRDAGLYTWDETFTLTAGKVQGGSEWHASLFAPVPSIIQAGGTKDFGAAGFYEKRLGDGETTSIAGQMRVGVSDDHTRTLVGGFAKHYVEGADLLLMAEVNGGLETFAASPGPSRFQLLTYAGLTYFPAQGLMLTAAHERYDADLSIRATARDGFSLALQFFPIAKWEIMALGKVERHGTNRRNTKLGMLQLHYYL